MSRPVDPDLPPGRHSKPRPAKPGPAKAATAKASMAESPELVRLRHRIDALDRRIVGLLNERAELGREVGRVKQAAGRRSVRDLEREREVLLRVALANLGPLAQADLLAIYRRLIAATRALEERDRGGG